MKRYLLISAVAFILLPLSSHAQYNFPLAELQKLTSKNASDFDTYVMGKDYSLQGKVSTNIMKVYASDKAGPQGKKYTIVRYQVPGAMTKITFSTTDKKFYLDVKSNLASSGLKYASQGEKTIENMQATCYNYANGALKVSLCTYSAEENWFVIEVHL
jgi:hypothetical protein